MSLAKISIILFIGFLVVLALGWNTRATDSEDLATAGPEVPFDNKTFYERAAVAQWLLRYDQVAWQTSDLVLTEEVAIRSKLGSEWFCLERDGRWHAVYGNYDRAKDRYNAVLQYVEADGVLQKMSNPLASKQMKPFARALCKVHDRLRPVSKELDIGFNQYVRRLENNHIEVWVLPGWQTDGRFVYGTEFRFVLNKQGRKILEETVPELNLSVQELTSDSDLLIPNDDADIPSVGQIFALLLARNSVAFAGIRNRSYVTVLIDVPTSDRQAWVQVSRDQDLQSAIQMITEYAAHDMSVEKAAKESSQP